MQVNLKCEQASDIRVQNKIRNCLIKFKANKDKCGVKTPVLAAVKSSESITYVKFGDQFCVSDINGAAKLLESNSFNVNLQPLVS